MSKISVIIPVYKVEKYLDKCVESVANQTYKDLEIILVDDGSPDNCPAVCDEWAKKDSRIKVIHKENGGVSSARNAGIDIAEGEYICFVDSDDFVRENYVQFLLSAIEETDADVSIMPFLYVGKTIQQKKVKNQLVRIDNMSLNEAKLVFSNDLMFGPVSKLYKADIIKQNKIKFPQNVHLGEDTIFVFTYLKYAASISFGEKAEYEYYTENSVATKKFWPEILRYINQRFEAFLSFFEAHKIEEQIKKEMLSVLAFESFEIATRRTFLRKPIKEFLKEYNEAYKFFSQFILQPFKKNQYLLHIAVDTGKQFLKNKIGKGR